MGKSTWSGPVISLNGFIGGADVNASDTQQGGTTAWTVTNATTLTNGTTSLDAATNEGVLVYVQDGAANSAIYAFSNGVSWVRCDNVAANVSTS
jgi:hypothetical protein